MEHRVSFEVTKKGASLKIDEKYYDRISKIPAFLLEELTTQQVGDIHEFFGVNLDPRGDKKKVFGE